jgi:hypothetical protein
MDIMDAMAVDTYRNVRIAINEQRLAVDTIFVNVEDSTVTLLARMRDSLSRFTRRWCVVCSMTISAHGRVQIAFIDGGAVNAIHGALIMVLMALGADRIALEVVLAHAVNRWAIMGIRIPVVTIGAI